MLRVLYRLVQSPLLLVIWNSVAACFALLFCWLRVLIGGKRE